MQRVNQERRVLGGTRSSLKRRDALCEKKSTMDTSYWRDAKRQKLVKAEDKSDKNDKIESIMDKFKAMDKENQLLMQQVPRMELGAFDMATEYPSPYPKSFYPTDKLYICEWCLGYTSTKRLLKHHEAEDCPQRSKRPPGRKIYEESIANGSLVVVEVDGRSEATYCQNLCLLGKSFIDQKTLYYDVSMFWFFVLCLHDSDGVHPMGYFSKEKESPEHYNLSCIVVFPPYRRKGYGSLLISLSYELSKREGTVGTPERPLSTLGRAAYVEYWRNIILTSLSNLKKSAISIESLAEMTGILCSDIIDTLTAENSIQVTRQGKKTVCTVDRVVLQETVASMREIRLCKPRQVKWKPVAKQSR